MKSCTLFSTLLLCLLFPFTVLAQTSNVGIGTTTPAASSLLELQSTNKGLLIPRMTYAQRNAITSPSTGLLIFQTDSIAPRTPATFYYYTGTQWIPFLTFTTGWDLYGNTGTNPAVNFLGTTDSVDWELKTNSTERMHVYAGGNVRLTNSNGVAEQLQFQERSDSGTAITSFRARPMQVDIPYTLPDTQGYPGTFLTNDGSGNLYWSPVFSGVTYAVTTLTQFNGSQNNVPLDSTKTIFRVSAAANMNVTGFANGWNGRMIIVVNIGNTSVALQNQSTSSIAANRIITSSGNSIAMQTNEAISLYYDGTDQRWRPIAKTP